jgi:choloylglycine hydrolase
VGKSYDYEIGIGHAFLNKSGVAKSALPTFPGMRPVRWTSKYASLTFNQFGREFPQSGMNEKGLVVEIMWLSTSRFPKPGPEEAINELQWIQYQLDNHESVAAMVEHASSPVVLSTYGKVHYLACDRTGQCAAFEYLDGKLVVTPPERMQANTLTNSTYTESVARLKRHAGFGGKLPVPKSNSSLDRFVRASSLAAELARKPGDRVKEAFQILDSVKNGEYTQWNMVYDLERMRVHFRTRASQSIKSIDFAKFEPSCRTPARVLDMNAGHQGDVTGEFWDATFEANQRLTEESFRHLSGKLPPGAAASVAAFPRSFSCTLDGG